MILGTGHAPGKAILFGEHAVVYGRPALAVPITQVGADAAVSEGEAGAGPIIDAEDLGLQIRLSEAAADQPLAAAARLALYNLGLPDPDWLISVRSSIPIASGLGSGAAVSAAIMRAIAAAAGKCILPPILSRLVYEIEKLHHGHPSGIDNTVVVMGQPVYFVRDRQPDILPIRHPFMLAIADTGIRSPTRVPVGDVRRAWNKDPDRYEDLFDRIAGIVGQARGLITLGNPAELGPLMDANHDLLREIGVSCVELDRLAEVARAAGAGGAKLSGAGRGGQLIALVDEYSSMAVADALLRAGAANVILTTVSYPNE